MKVAGWVLVAVALLAALVTLDPAVVGLSQVYPVALAIAMRGWLAIGGIGLGLVLIIVSLILHGTKGKGRRLLVLGIVAVLVGAGHGGVLAERGLDAGGAFGPKPDGAVDILTLNTLAMTAGASEIADLINQVDPDVVALQETPADEAQRIADATDVDYQVFTATTGTQAVQATALLVAQSMGEYVQTEAPRGTFANVWAQPADGVTGPSLMAIHTAPPVLDIAVWRTEVAGLTALCDRVPGLVMAGDFNATVDHAGLRQASCVDSSVGAGGVGTWPATSRPWLGTVIDHVLVDPNTWAPSDARILEAPGGGDHRAVLVRILPAPDV